MCLGDLLYLDEYDKVHNTEFEDYLKLSTIDQNIKENFGYLFKKDFNNINFIIDNSEKKLKNKLPELDDLINQNFYNFGNSKNFLKSKFKDII